MKLFIDSGNIKDIEALAAIGITGPLATDLAAQTRTLVSIENLRNAASLRGENFSEDRLRVIQAALQRNLDQFQLVRDLDIDFFTRRTERDPGPVSTDSINWLTWFHVCSGMIGSHSIRPHSLSGLATLFQSPCFLVRLKR